MTRLISEQVLKDNNTGDPNSILTLQLSHKALSDVSCLGKFKNLERLELKLNNLTSLEGLRSCVNLKWLSVVENKLESLEGIQGLTKLTVLNAGKNKLKSVDQVGSLVSLRALILNENEIVSICKLDRMKDLNTLVLSKNPICKIDEALVNVKSITKLSLSYCQLQGIGSSLKSCVELRELRLAHNEIKSLPDELVHNSKLQNLDLGNNVITRWSDLQVIKSLMNLRNLNLQGNPVATIDKMTRKIQKALPKLQVFNARPVGKRTKNEKDDITELIQDFLVASEGQHVRDSSKEKKSEKPHQITESKDENLEASADVGIKSSKKRKKSVDVSNKEVRVLDEENIGHDKGRQFETPVKDRKKESLVVTVDPDIENKSTRKMLKKEDKPLGKVLVVDENVTKVEKKRKDKKQSELDVIDDAEASFVELFKMEDAENLSHGGDMEVSNKVRKGVSLVGGTETSFAKRKNSEMLNMEPLSHPLAEIGMGGPSTWGDE